MSVSLISNYRTGVRDSQRWLEFGWRLCEGWTGGYMRVGLEGTKVKGCYKLITRGPMLELLNPIADVVRGIWLQLMCYTLPKHLCP